MDESQLRTIEKIEQFLGASAEVTFTAHASDVERYAHISRVLKRFLPPLIKRYKAPVALFARKYTTLDIALLVEMDKAREYVCGPAITHLFKRAFSTYGDMRYERLAKLSSSHLYELRKSVGYQRLRVSFTKTHPACSCIGVRTAPHPNGRAGFVRIDSVHQGDEDGMKGVYHITCVDITSQWQVEACVQGISEIFLLPVLELVIAQFPFVIEGFHLENGSQYINDKVAKMLEMLRIEKTKSRSRQSNDNALTGSKNASIVRKHMGYAHIPKKHAQPINIFTRNTSIRGSICAAPACSQPTRSTQKARS